MKSTYIQPASTTITLQPQQMLASSPTQNAVKINNGTTQQPNVGASGALSDKKVWDSRIWSACEDK